MFRIHIFLGLVYLSTASCITHYNRQISQFYDTVQCANDPSQHYCIYIPDSLSRKEKCPVVFLLDPGGEANSAVLKYMGIANKYKVILASSYNVKNGPYTSNRNSLQTMIGDVLTNYPVNESAQILAGFSGGSRIAYVYASRETSIKGVIASGAYFPGGDNNFVPPAFNYSAIVGSYDFNYAEGLNMHNLMWKYNKPHQFVVFEGEHGWPPENTLERSLVFQLSLISDYAPYKYRYLEMERNALQQSNESGDLINSAWIMDNIKIVDQQVQTAYQMLIKNVKYKLKVREFESSFQIEDSLKNIIVGGVRGILLKAENINGETTQTMEWWKKRISEMKGISNKTDDLYTANAAHRALSHIGIILWEVNRKVFQEKHFDQALEAAEILVEAFPTNETYRALVAESLLALGETERAKQVYQEALNLGFVKNNKFLKFSPYIKQLSSLTEKTALN